MSPLKTFCAYRSKKKTGCFMFWREKHKKKYYYYTVMKMIKNYLFPVCKQDRQLKIEGDIYIKTG
jgi:hypothetical protein